MPYSIFGASVKGASHLAKGSPCQDVWVGERVDASWSVIAVADGAGSAERSDVGAFVAATSAVASIKTTIEGDSLQAWEPARLAREAVIHARQELEKKALELTCALKDLASTLIVSLIHHDTVTTAHIGDGGVIVATATGLVLASGPEETEYANETTFVTSEDWESELRVSETLAGVVALAAFSDGCQRAALEISEGRLAPYARFLEPLFSYASTTTDLPTLAEDLRLLLSSSKLSDISDDDKTLVIGVSRPD
jgi:serine/threonine protein phosphatase PrpC